MVALKAIYTGVHLERNRGRKRPLHKIRIHKNGPFTKIRSSKTAPSQNYDPQKTDFSQNSRHRKSLFRPVFSVFPVSSIRDKCPNLMKLLSLSVIIPFSSASVERLFSQMNLICTEMRSKLSQKSLDRHLRIVLNGPEKLSQEHCDAIIDIFLSTGNRRINL